MKRLLTFAIVAACLCNAQNKYEQHNLVSDVAGMADHLDPCLVNPWGIVATATSPFWVSANGTGLSTLYNGNGVASSLIVSVPGPAGTAAPGQQCGATALGPGAPSGIIVNDTSSFLIGSSPAGFIFSSEQGVVVGWNSGKTATVMADRSAAGAVYKGLATAARSEGPLLYVADFGNGKVDVYDGNMNLLSLPGAFKDPQIPAGFAPFNVANLGGTLYVSYAKQDAAHHDDVAGPGNGYVDIYDLNGLLLSRLVSMGPLNSPWGMTIAPAGFGSFGGALLVGNFGDGAINAFDPVTGAYLGALQNGAGAAIHVQGLWGITFGNGSKSTPGAVPSGGDANTLYFAAGISDENHGLLGTIQPAPAISSNGVVGAATFAAAAAPGGFVAVFGNSLAATTRTWATVDFVNGQLPTQLDGVSVTIDGKPAYVYFVSPNQIDAIAPADSAIGPVAVTVTNNGISSAAATVQLQAAAPGLFAAGKYAVATHANGTLVGPLNGPLAGASPAKVGETIVIYGTGFGETSPAVDGQVVTTPVPLGATPLATIGGVSAKVVFAGLSQAGLDQFNVTVPAIPNASATGVDVPVVFSSGASSSQAGLSITVQSGN